jgi:hypothetical protein
LRFEFSPAKPLSKSQATGLHQKKIPPMQTKLISLQCDADDLDTCETKTTELKPVQPAAPNHFRQVRSQEIVVSGDWVMNKSQELEPWEGPSGFRADSFVMTVYRQESRR